MEAQDLIVKQLTRIEKNQDEQLRYIIKIDKRTVASEIKIKLLGVGIMGMFYFVFDVVKKKFLGL